MDLYLLEKHSVGFSNKKIEQIVGYKLQVPEFNTEVVLDMVQKWKDEGSWPLFP